MVEHAMHLMKSPLYLIKKADNRHHQHEIKGTCPIRQMFGFAERDLYTPVLCHSCEHSRRINTAVNTERGCKTPRSDTNLEPMPEIRDRPTEYPQLYLVYTIVFIEPRIIISGMFVKDDA